MNHVPEFADPFQAEARDREDASALTRAQDRTEKLIRETEEQLTDEPQHELLEQKDVEVTFDSKPLPREKKRKGLRKGKPAPKEPDSLMDTGKSSCGAYSPRGTVC